MIERNKKLCIIFEWSLKFEWHQLNMKITMVLYSQYGVNIKYPKIKQCSFDKKAFASIQILYTIKRWWKIDRKLDDCIILHKLHVVQKGNLFIVSFERSIEYLKAVRIQLMTLRHFSTFTYSKNILSIIKCDMFQ